MLTYKNPKAKSCVVCERVFVPDRMGQVVCRGSCGLKKARAEREAAEKAERESVKVVAPSLTPDSYTPVKRGQRQVNGCSSLSHPG